MNKTKINKILCITMASLPSFCWTAQPEAKNQLAPSEQPQEVAQPVILPAMQASPVDQPIKEPEKSQEPAITSPEPAPVQASIVTQQITEPKTPELPVRRVIAPGSKPYADKKERVYQGPDEDIMALEKLEKESKKDSTTTESSTVDVPGNGDDLIEFQFENTDLKNVITQIGILFDVTFIADDILNPLPQGVTGTSGSKVSFRTYKAMTKKQAWNLFLSVLDIAGFTLSPQPNIDKKSLVFRVVPLVKAGKSVVAGYPVAAYIGVDPSELPDNDQVVRYVYFVENGNMSVILNVVDKLRSSTSDLVSLTDAKAFIVTDKSYNIKTLMVIVKELDRVSMPQSMSVLKLRRADAKDVKLLMDQLMGNDESKAQPMYMPQRQQPTAFYFPQSTRIIAENRTNSLIILGSPEAIDKITSFVRKHVDKDQDVHHSPLFYYDLRFADAAGVVKILEETVSKFGKEPETEAGKVGGVRGVDKYTKPMTFVADPATNRIIIRGEYQDYIMVKNLIKKIDEPQPQVAIEVLVMEINVAMIKSLGAQLRNKIEKCGNFGGIFGNKLQFQTSGFANQGKIVEREPVGDTGTAPDRLMGNLLNLISGLDVGQTVLSLGSDIFGVWGLFQFLETSNAAELVSNPFLIAANKQKATVKVGEIRRVVTSDVLGGSSGSSSGFEDNEAVLEVNITPQINSDGMITLDIHVGLQTFRAGTDASNVAKLTKQIDTKAIVADKEILALGGLIQNRSDEAGYKTPVLGDVPILGWLFKNKKTDRSRDNLLILISSQILDPLAPMTTSKYTTNHIDDYHGTLDSMHVLAENRDPIYRMFFTEDKKSVGNRVEEAIFTKPARREEKVQKRLKKQQKLHPATIPPKTELEQKEFLQNIPEKPKEVSLIDDVPDTHEVTA